MRKLLFKTAMVRAVCGLVFALALIPVIARASSSGQPAPLAPEDGAILRSFSVTLQWDLPTGTTQYQLYVVPADGPAMNLIRNAESGFTIPSPPQWYGLLPDMTYTWKLRASSATASTGADDASWGPWSEGRTFRTPKVSSQSIKLIAPSNGSPVAEVTPTLSWSSTDSSIWYFEVQVSKDPTFTTNPASSTAPVYWELLHGGMTQPVNSYKIPVGQPLESDSTYYWRVRPRVQGGGSSIDWTPSASFSTTGTQTVTLADNGRTFDLLTGDLLSVDLGTAYQWMVTVEKESILEPLPTMGLAAMPAMYRAIRPGETKLSATGDLPCRNARPPCLAPSLLFEIHVVVHNDMVITRAPIDASSIEPAGANPTQYFANVDSGLPNGCTRFYRYTVSREQEEPSSSKSSIWFQRTIQSLALRYTAPSATAYLLSTSSSREERTLYG
ncbi:MAG: hypothetical protein EXR50_06180 [Dehalococcoidia bacterium]|nr:hypothetical protein [Dehalococcoidia bacterium]